VPADGMTLTLNAEARPAGPCDIVVRRGVLDDAGRLIASAAPAARYALLAPEPVADLHGSRVLQCLRAADLDVQPFTFSDGEAAKTRETWARLTDRMLDAGFGRDSAVIALGGGVAGDVAGFVAATYMRGVPVVQVPTTLLAMIDAAVGGKTGVDVPAGKNLVGAFHQPALVLMDPLVLSTLPRPHLRAGLAEAVKHGAILDAEYFAWIHRHAAGLLAGDAELTVHLVARSVELKAAIAAEDPYERGRRAILNFGHTAAHALEHASGYAMLHGHAVAAGMLVEAEAGETLGVTAAGTRQQLLELLRRCELPVHTGPYEAAALLAAMRLDKKARGGAPRLALLARVGACAADPAGSWTHAVPVEVLSRALDGVMRPSDTV
jgi:3-dehydroquinate synthase